MNAMTIDLRYVIPVVALFAPAPLLRALAIFWGSKIAPEFGFVLSVFLGLATLAVSVPCLLNCKPIPFTIGGKRDD